MYIDVRLEHVAEIFNHRSPVPSPQRVQLEALGRPAPFVDGQIAAIAHVHGLVRVTTNDKDFGRFKG